MLAIWTVILHRAGEHSQRIEMAPRDYKRAHKDLAEKYSDQDIVALILGRHIAYTFPRSHKLSASAYLIEENDNEPTRGSD